MLSKVMITCCNLLNKSCHFGERGTKTNFKCDGLLQKVRVKIHGTNNTIFINRGARLKNCRIYINGNNCQITVGENCCLIDAEFYIEDDKSVIVIQRDTMICGKSQLAAIEGCSIVIGKQCLFSSNINLRTGDSHAIVDSNGIRINTSKNICIGDHVWIGNGVTILKGVTINENTIVGVGSIVSKPCSESNCIIAGNPATIIKTGINWKYER